jgi:hypothetical protein
MSTKKDDESQKYESNNEEIYSKKAIGNSLGKSSNALTGMSVTAAARSRKIFDVAAASLLTSLKAGEECLSTDAINLTHQNFAAEDFQPEDEDLNLASTLKSNQTSFILIAQIQSCISQLVDWYSRDICCCDTSICNPYVPKSP